MVDILQAKIKTIQFKCFCLLKDYNKKPRYFPDRILEVSQVRSNGAQPRYRF